MRRSLGLRSRVFESLYSDCGGIGETVSRFPVKEEFRGQHSNITPCTHSSEEEHPPVERKAGISKFLGCAVGVRRFESGLRDTVVPSVAQRESAYKRVMPVRIRHLGEYPRLAQMGERPVWSIGVMGTRLILSQLSRVQFPHGLPSSVGLEVRIPDFHSARTPVRIRHGVRWKADFRVRFYGPWLGFG